ncbi:MAG: sugar phosphate isomerase/epimerase [Spirochaetaceae bacterium]|nr:MAG: sugar phosphate isomerase/epimerase [Spirochaetaceae bacterium]
MSSAFPYTLSYQTVLPDDYRSNQAFANTLRQFRDAGLWGLELNMADPATMDYQDVVEFLGGFDLRLSMFATGLSAKTAGLSLSSADEAERLRAVETCSEYLRWVQDDDVGAIIGFMKGMDRSDPGAARTAFRRSVLELAPVASDTRTPLIIEATNRYETPVANSLEDTLELIDGTPAEWVRILPDTFHMNIEEADQAAALTNAFPRIMSIHLSENNRTLPGRGGFDFAAFFRTVKTIGYTGRFAMEGNIVGSEGDDVARAADAVRAAWTSAV